MKIGIPNSLFYHKYGYLWKKFFDYLGVEYIVSPNTNKTILEKGKRLATDETCIPCKIYLGHIDYLKDKCDMVLVPRFLGIEKQKIECIKFNSIYDVVKNTFNNLDLLEYDIDYTKNKYEKKEFIKLGNRLNKNSKDSLIAYNNALADYKKNKIKLHTEQEEKINSDKTKVLILSHSYNSYDKLIGKQINKILTKYDIELIYSDRLITNVDKSYKYSETLYWSSNKEILNALDYYHNKVNGIILLTAFPCGNDCLVNELILRKVKDIPIINIVIDELNSEVGLITRLESFIDIINESENIYEKNY